MKDRLIDALNAINVAELDRADWISVGMALKEEGCDCSVWDEWSKNDSRYHPGECSKQWESFKGSSNPVKGGTIIELAKRFGWSGKAKTDEAFDWEDFIMQDEPEGFQSYNYLNGPEVWNPAEQIKTYIRTLFDDDELVSYVTSDVRQINEEKWVPGKGDFDRTAGELLEALEKHNDDIGMVFGDYNPECGAWIRFNPVDGKGVKNENVTRFKYALVECDNISVQEQDALYRQHELPIACLVYSGGKSLHAIVKVDAQNLEEYRKRVDYLYDYLSRHGVDIDKQNRNPSRLSRMPGVERNGKKQYIVTTNIGRKNWLDWLEFAEDEDDPLPPFESLADLMKNPPALKDPIIEGILRCGHKMLISAASKSGKSFLLLELALACATGTKWIGFDVKKGKVLYVNLEIDKASFLDRIRKQCETLNLDYRKIRDFVPWNLRGYSGAITFDKITDKIIRRAKDEKFTMIVVDPIYKVLSGDENNASDMAAFCNTFDKLAETIGASVVYAHHHSKGAQGGKAAIDRASGSGVFARDPDAILDLTELIVPEDIANKVFETPTAKAFRLDFTLREFAEPEPINLIFDYPIHRVDETGELKKCGIAGDVSGARANNPKNAGREARREMYLNAYEYCSGLYEDARSVTVEDMADYLQVGEKTIRENIKKLCGDILYVNCDCVWQTKWKEKKKS